MKRLIFLGILVNSLSFCALAQTEFAPIGAKWWYDYINYDNTPISHVTYESVGDTIIEGKDCKVLVKAFLYIDGLPRDTTKIYLHQDSSTIYYYWLDSFNFLYDFNPKAGSKWPSEIREAIGILRYIQTTWIQ